MADELATITGTIYRNTADDADRVPWVGARVLATPVLLDETAAIADSRTTRGALTDSAGLATLHLWPGAWKIHLPDGEVIDGDGTGVVVEAGTTYTLLELRGYVAPPGTSVTTVQLPTGGTSGQLLAKASGDDYDVEWKSAAGVSGGGFPLQSVTVESDMTVSKATWPTDQIVTAVFTQDTTGGHTLTHDAVLASGVDWSPGTLPGSETVTTWRHSTALGWVVEGCWISVAGSASADVTPPTAGTLSSSAITGSSFTLTVTGATDAGGLHAQPYRFSTDNGASWSAWQTLEHYNATGLDDSTEYTCVHQVRDAALNTTTGASIAVTTATPDPGNEPPEWTATFTMGTPTSTNVTATASAMATDDTAVAGYEVSYNGGSSWASITPAGSVFTLTGTAETTYSTTQLRAVDGDGAYSTALAVSSYTLAAETAAVTATYRGRINGASGADFAIGDAPTGGATRSVIVAYVALYDGAAPTGMTIGGVSATRDAYYDGSGTWQTQQPVAMFHAAVPTGTTATITATGGGGTGPKMYVWTTDAAVTCIEAEVSDGSTGTETVALATASGGVAVAAAAGQFGINEAYGWAAGMDTDEYVANYAAAHGATTGASKTVTWSGYRNRMVAAAYGAV